MTEHHDLQSHVPTLLARARVLLRLGGGPDDALGPGELKRAAEVVSALHAGLVGERALARPATYDARIHLGAYLLWWWPQSYAKVRAALRLLPAPLPPGARVLDLGAGPGPGAIAALDHVSTLYERQTPPEALALDASELALAEARELKGALHLGVRYHELGAPLPLDGKFELILAANVISELPGDAPSRARLFAGLAEKHLAPGGVLLLLEPALRETGRALLELRDRLLAEHGLRAVAPCLTQRPCPALQHPRDWCTAARPWAAPRHVKQLAQALALRADEELSFAFVALGREAALPAPDAYRVVGLPPPEKGKKRIWVCNDAGRVAAARLERDASASNAAFESLERGDLVVLRGLVARGDGLRVGRDAEVSTPALASTPAAPVSPAVPERKPGP